MHRSRAHALLWILTPNPEIIPGKDGLSVRDNPVIVLGFSRGFHFASLLDYFHVRTEEGGVLLLVSYWYTP